MKQGGFVKVSGYSFDPKTIKSYVAGYKDLSPKARHALRDIFDCLWESESNSVSDDSKLIAYTGFTKREWTGIKQEFFAMKKNFISLSDGQWTSPWLKSQKQKVEEIEADNPQLSKSYTSLKDDDSFEDEDFNDIDEEDSSATDKIERLQQATNNANTGTPTLYKETRRKKTVVERSRDMNKKILEKYKGVLNE